MRELHEEVGIKLDPSAVLGRLDDYATRSGYVISPIVVWIEDLSGLQAMLPKWRWFTRFPSVNYYEKTRRYSMTPNPPASQLCVCHSVTNGLQHPVRRLLTSSGKSRCWGVKHALPTLINPGLPGLSAVQTNKKCLPEYVTVHNSPVAKKGEN